MPRIENPPSFRQVTVHYTTQELAQILADHARATSGCTGVGEISIYGDNNQHKAMVVFKEKIDAKDDSSGQEEHRPRTVGFDRFGEQD